MNLDIELVLVILIVITGVLYLIDARFFAPARKQLVAKGQTVRIPIIYDYARSFFPILLIVLLLRSFLVEPFIIPSGSLKPTLLIGDFVVVNKYIYGLRLPVLRNKIKNWSAPTRGDIVVFHPPPEESTHYIKRFVGVPGDHIQYKNKVLYINGVEAKQKIVGTTRDYESDGMVFNVEIREEQLGKVKHRIFVQPDKIAEDFDVVVPAGHYFAMGDNRDDSNDSRYWGPVPEYDIVGKASYIWMSWNNRAKKILDYIRWQRIGEKIK